MKHKFNRRALIEIIENGYYNKIDHLKDRRTGKTTAIALRTIANAIDNPGMKIPVRNHPPTDNLSGNNDLMKKISKIVEMLELTGFTLYYKVWMISCDNVIGISDEDIERLKMKVYQISELKRLEDEIEYIIDIPK